MKKHDSKCQIAPIVYIVIIVITSILMIATIVFILNNDEYQNDMIVKVIPIYWAIITFFAKYLSDYNKDKQSNKRYWFRNFILDSQVREVNKFIDKTKKLIKQCEEVKRSVSTKDITVDEYIEQTEEAFSEIASSYLIMFAEITAGIGFIKVYDSEFYENMMAIYQDMQDRFMTILDENAEKFKVINAESFLGEFEEKRTELLELIYNQSMK